MSAMSLIGVSSAVMFVTGCSLLLGHYFGIVVLKCLMFVVCSSRDLVQLCHQRTNPRFVLTDCLLELSLTADKSCLRFGVITQCCVFQCFFVLQLLNSVGDLV